MNKQFCRLTRIALLMLLLMGVLSTAVADNYTWKDSKGNWHVTNDRESIPPEILEKMDQSAGSRYQQHDDDSSLFYYRGFKEMEVAPGTILRHGDFLLVLDFIDQGRVSPGKEIQRKKFICLLLGNGGVVTEFSLHAFFFMTGDIVRATSDQKTRSDYERFKSNRSGIFAITGSYSPERQADEWKAVLLNDGGNNRR
jgi:hypothetical protein